jgi:hypothetical protein
MGGQHLPLGLSQAFGHSGQAREYRIAPLQLAPRYLEHHIRIEQRLYLRAARTGLHA